MADKLPKLHSCVLCRHRRVKCDRQQPCSNCVKAHVECIHKAPAPARRGKGRVSREDLVRRLRQYENMLKSYGAKIEELEGAGAGAGELDSKDTPSTFKLSVERDHTSPSSDDEASKPLTHSLWTSLSDEILNDPLESQPSNSNLDVSDSAPEATVSSLIFDLRLGDMSLTHLHPPAAQIFSLWQTFLDHVNPLVKIIHAPTLQRRILEASVAVEQVSRPLEALMFAIYSCAVTSLSHEECVELAGESRDTLMAVYHRAAEQALIRAGFLKTLDIVVLQAAVLFAITARLRGDPGEFWVFAGIMLRIGQRMGMHRESNLVNLPVLEAEIRRRVWWFIVMLDNRSGDRAGVGAPATTARWDTAAPLNVNDSDITPNMKVPPSNRVGATEMIFCSTMYEMGSFLVRTSSPLIGSDNSWQKITSHSVPLADREKSIDELVDYMEQKALKYCDPVIPLHILARNMVMTLTNRMRFATLHPRQYPDRGASMPKKEKDKLFALCLTILEQDNFFHSTPSLRGFIWRFFEFVGLDALIYLLSELQRQSTGSRADQAWLQIETAFKHHPELLSDTKKALYRAVGNLTLKSWELREGEFNKQHLSPPEGSLPWFVSSLRLLRTQDFGSPSNFRPPEREMGNLGFDNNDQNYDKFWDDFDNSINTFQMPDPLSTDYLDPMDWALK